MTYEPIMGITIVLIIGIIAIAIWMYFSITSYNECTKQENIVCPTYYCNNLSDGSSGTKCVNDDPSIPSHNAFRYTDASKTNFVCQKQTIK